MSSLPSLLKSPVATADAPAAGRRVVGALRRTWPVAGTSCSVCGAGVTLTALTATVVLVAVAIGVLVAAGVGVLVGALVGVSVGTGVGLTVVQTFTRFFFPCTFLVTKWHFFLAGIARARFFPGAACEWPG